MREFFILGGREKEGQIRRNSVATDTPFDFAQGRLCRRHDKMKGPRNRKLRTGVSAPHRIADKSVRATRVL